MSSDNNFNLNSLRWVKQEIDTSLMAARDGIQRYATDSSQPQALEESLRQLTDALGTLEIAEIHGGALLAREIRDVLVALKERKPEDHLKDPDTVSRPVVRALIQLSDYLDYIEAGNPDVPVVLVNAINDLRLIRHAELLSGEIADIPGLEGDEAVLSRQPRARESVRDLAGVARLVFELGLLGWYRRKNVEASLNKMATVCRRLKNASAHNASRRLWWVSEALISGLRSGVLPHSYSLKFLVGRIDRQIKQLQKMGDKAFAEAVPCALIKSMLYYIASAPPGDAVVDEVRDVYFPTDGEQAKGALNAARISLAGQNSELYRTLAGALQEKIASIKDMLELHVLAEDDPDRHLRDALPLLRELAQTLQMLGMRHQQAFVLDHLERLEQRLTQDDAIAAEEIDTLAEMLVGVESAVHSFSMLGQNFIAAAASGQAGDDTAVKGMVADEEFRQIRATVVRESLENLEKCKAAFQQYATNPNILSVLESVPETLGQISGAMLLVSEERVASLLDSVSGFVQRRHDAGKVITHPELEHLAEAVSAVDVYLEVLDSSGLQQTPYLDRGVSAMALLDPEAEVEDADPTRMFEADALLDEPSRLFNPETLIVDFNSLDDAADEVVPVPPAPVSIDEEDRADRVVDDDAVEVADDSMLFEAATLTIAGVEGEPRLDILETDALDDESGFVGRSAVVAEGNDEDPFSASQMLQIDEPGDGGEADEELIAIDFDDAGTPAESLIEVAPSAGTGTEPRSQADDPDAAVEAPAADGDRTEVVELAAMDHRFEPSAEKPEEEMPVEAPADATQPIDAVDVSVIADAFDDEPASPRDDSEIVEAPTLTVSGIEVEELTSLDGELSEMVPFPTITPHDEALDSGPGEALDTLAGMEIDDGLSVAGTEEAVADAVDDESRVEEPTADGLEDDIGTAGAFLFPDASSATLDGAGGDATTGVGGLPEEVEPLSEVVSTAESMVDESGVRKLDLESVDELAVDELEVDDVPVDDEVLTLVDVLPDDEVVTESSMVAAVPAEEPAAANEAEPEPAAFAGLSVLKAGADEEIIEIFIEEFAEETAVLESHYPHWRDDRNNRDALITLRRAFHTLKGSARLVGAEIAGEFAWLHEKLLNEVIDGARPVTAAVVESVGAGIALLPRLLQQLQEGAAPDAGVKRHVARLEALLANEAETGVAAEDGAEETAEPETLISALQDPALMEIFADETAGHLQRLEALLRQFDEGSAGEAEREALFRTVHTLNGSARTAKVPAVFEPSAAFEHYLDLKFQAGGELTAADIDHLRELHGHVVAVLDAIRGGEPAPDGGSLVATARQLAAALEVEPTPADTESTPSAGAETAAQSDEEALPAVSRELVEVFLDESEEILEHCDDAMQRWQQNPEDMDLVRELYRELHTLKGSARMAGLQQIGDLSHAVETLLTAVEAGEAKADKSLFTVVFGAIDRFGEMNEAVRAGRAVAPADALIDLLTRIQQGQQLSEADLAILKRGTGAEPAPAQAPEAAPVTELPQATERFESHLADLMPQQTGVGADGELLVSRLQDTVKVSPDLLDQFVDSVGEINILNSRVEQQISAFGFNLQELERTISRLTEQLRQLEMEAEAQILSHFDGHRVNPDETGINEYFDPLELDRYSTIQQLSRALAESTDDLVSLHQLLSEERRDVENLVQQEGRVGNSLQEALMRTRMSPFKMMVPRLRRVVRGVALELGKEVDFRIEGEEQELDRKVLEGMVVPLEHLLRNALAHGIESPSQRQAAGKPEAGTITVSVHRDGPEVVIEVSDDGAGIDRQAVRRRAIEKGIVGADAELTDAEIDALILHPGFSTATEVSQIAGRGVGMDVVQEQLRHLNGLLEISSTAGKGTTFRIRLPFTMAINQSLLVRVGAHSYAIPINTVEGVVQVSDRVLAEKLAGGDPVIDYADRNYRLYRLDEVLENARMEPLQASGETRPVLLVGSGEHAIALIVDEIQGNQDVVVKPIGSLLNSVPGLGGATILGDGRVILILDTAGIIRAATGGRESIERREADDRQAHERRPTIMVVDDSITIRRVTEKMLERHHFNVVTAKDGLDAVARLEEVKPDMMLLDIEMPRMDGFELAAHLQNSEQHQDIPIIMISSRTGKKHRERAAGLGVREFLGKPYQDSELLSHIDALLQQKEGMNRHVG